MTNVVETKVTITTSVHQLSTKLIYNQLFLPVDNSFLDIDVTDSLSEFPDLKKMIHSYIDYTTNGKGMFIFMKWQHIFYYLL